jgi:ABC-type amino acid transport substrate-binding protein
MKKEKIIDLFKNSKGNFIIHKPPKSLYGIPVAKKEVAELRKTLKLALKEYNEWGKFIATLNKKLVKLDK